MATARAPLPAGYVTGMANFRPLAPAPRQGAILLIGGYNIDLSITVQVGVNEKEFIVAGALNLGV